MEMGNFEPVKIYFWAPYANFPKFPLSEAIIYSMHAILLTLGIITGFFLTGFLFTRLLGARHSILSDFMISSVILFQCIFWLAVIGIRISFPSVLSVLVAVSGVLLVLNYRIRDSKSSEFNVQVDFSGISKQLPFLVPLAAVSVLMLLRSVLQPFNYCDAEFRWNHLALKILETGNISFYPPLTAEDFSSYFYVDGIPPLVSFSYYWLYASYGRPEMILTGLLVTLQYCLLLWLAYRISEKLFSSAQAGVFAAIILATSTLAFFSVVMGQETGLTALSLAATIYYLTENDKGTVKSMILAGFATSLGALSREYGCTFLVCGILVCLWRKENAKLIGVYILTVMVLAAPWYIRTWILSGNPFYSISSLGGLFPVNEVRCGIFNAYEQYFGFSNHPMMKLNYLATSLLFTAPIQATIGIIASVLLFRKYGYLVVSAAIIFVLWIYSVGQTNGGFFYSVRVLSPAIIVLSILCGGAFSLWTMSKKKIAYFILGVIFLISFIQDITVPMPIWRLNSGDITTAAFAPMNFVGNRIFAYVEPLPDNSKIISDSPFFHAALSSNPQRGIMLIPVWSPELSFLFKDGDIPSMLAELRKRNIRYIMHEGGSVNDNYLGKFTFFRDFRKFAKPYVMENGKCVIYELYE